jgi:hypothetical protein
VFASTLALLGVAGGLGAGCSQDQSAGRVRALQQAGATTFVCLAPLPSVTGDDSTNRADTPESVAAVALPLTECANERTDDPTVPHLYALALQPLRGEVAMIDLTAERAPLVDADPLTPGTNFLPVGAAPTDIVATPGGTATFVSVGEAGYEGIYALPADRLRGAAPKLSDWPSCSLPERPASIELLVDAAGPSGALRPRCDTEYGADEGDTTCGDEAASHCHGDLAADAAAAGTPGRYKLLVTLPHAGGIAIVDAQSLLDQEGGAFGPCPIERFVPLDVKLSTDVAPMPEPAEACVPTETASPKVTGYKAEPSDVAVAPRSGGGYRLFVSDAGSPVIHRLDLPTACDVSELDPLLATSVENPERVVTTSRVAVSPLTFGLKRYLYAVDELDGSVIAYDVSDDVTSRSPLLRRHPERNPFQPADRVRFGSPPREILFAERRGDTIDPATGTNVAVRCDPNAGASTDAANYRTASDFSSGAGPRKLRGVFGFAVLASGNVVALDVDDLDAGCRGPSAHHPLFGCDDTTANIEGASSEYSCATVAPHQPRSSAYLAYRENVVATQPGLEALPLLFDKDGVVLSATDEGAPRMRATVPVETPPFDLTLPIASGSTAVDPLTGLLKAADVDAASAHVLAMNHDDPRAHILAQSWTVTYEGAIPGFTGHFASQVPTAEGFEFRDPASGFCGRGVRGASAVADELVALEGVTAEQAAVEAQALADYVQVTSDTPVLGDKYWDEQSTCSFASCQQAYGTSRNPLPTRDLRITVAKDDVLFVEPRDGAINPPLKCCFPNVVEFEVRGGSQWIVLGSQVGFLHRGAPDKDGVCRSRCDGRLGRLDGRVREVTMDEPVRDDAPRAFRNPFFRFAIRSGTRTTREMRFEFATQGQFSPLQLALLGTSGSTDIQPAAATFLPTTDEIVVSDGSLQGLTLVKLDTFSVSRQYQ